MGRSLPGVGPNGRRAVRECDRDRLPSGHFARRFIDAHNRSGAGHRGSARFEVQAGPPDRSLDRDWDPDGGRLLPGNRLPDMVIERTDCSKPRPRELIPVGSAGRSHRNGVRAAEGGRGTPGPWAAPRVSQSLVRCEECGRPRAEVRTLPLLAWSGLQAWQGCFLHGSGRSAD